MDYKDENKWLMLGDCLERMRDLPDGSVDSIVTDPPYELGFMGKGWDKSGIANSVEMWHEVLRVLKPGGHLLAFSGSRTYHRMVCAIEDAGFEIRDQIMWLYGSGFPKSLNVSKAIDRAAGAVREVIGFDAEKAKKQTASTANVPYGGNGNSGAITAPATEAARQWQGWGTALKPAHEPIVVARKPLVRTVAANVLEHGTGALNIDGCRVAGPGAAKWATPRGRIWTTDSEATGELVQNDKGRFPANLIHDGSDEVVELFPVTSKNSAARFFYCAKASKKDRGEGNKHPTVKPTDLMRYLCRLVTPPNGIVLDPFMGSGSTGKAAMLEGFSFVGIELESESFDIAKQRIEYAQRQENLL